MKYQGNLIKMETLFSKPIQYYLTLENDKIHLNEMLGRHFSIKFLNEINCIACDIKTPKSYHQGYCYQCFISSPQTDVGILHPEKDKSHEGISRDMEWAKENSLTDHYVYLALTSQLKIGVTRATQVPTRWIDQGASQAIRLAKTPYRKLAGDIEVFFKDYVSDKTQWKQMLLSSSSDIDLLSEKQRLAALLPEELKQYVTIDNRVTDLVYPGQYQFDKIYQQNLDESNKIEGDLLAIRGQYLVFKQGFALNIRRHNGYKIELSID